MGSQVTESSGAPLFSNFKSLLGLLSEAVYNTGDANLSHTTQTYLGFKSYLHVFCGLLKVFDQSEQNMALPKLATRILYEAM